MDAAMIQKAMETSMAPVQVMARQVEALVERGAAFDKAVSEISKVADALGQLESRIAKIEGQPMPVQNEPSVRAVAMEKVIGGMPSTRPDGNMEKSERAHYEKVFATTNNKILKQEVGNELALDELRAMYRAS